MGWAGKRRSATRPRDGPDRGLKPTANFHTVALRPGRRLANRTDRDRSPVAAGGGGESRSGIRRLPFVVMRCEPGAPLLLGPHALKMRAKAIQKTKRKGL